MSFLEEEQPSGLAAAAGQEPIPQPDSQKPEPRLLTRPDRQANPDLPRAPRHRQVPAEKGLHTWSKRLAARRTRERKRSANPKKASQPHLRPGRGFRFWLALGSGLLLLLLLTAAGFLLSLRHSMGAALPQLDGSVQVAGLSARVTVARDAQGVPTITAANLPDLLFAQGYTTAADRLWQMDGLRRHAAGELADILGPSLVEHDRRQRYLQLRAAADRAVAQLPQDQLVQLEAYARGVNAYIESHHGALPMEFRLLAYTPEPWTPRDTLLVSLAMWQDLSTEFPRKLDREAFSAHLPPELLNDLYPVGSWRDKPPAAQGRDITAPHLVEQIPLDPSQSHLQLPEAPKVAPDDLLAVSTALAGTHRCDGCRSGSNNWAVSGAHTASGAPLLSNDMHLTLSIPDAWYEASLHADTGNPTDGPTRLDVTGFTLPGVPFVIVGRNTHVAWGVTNLGADVQDLRVEHLRGAAESTEYERADGSWTPVTHHAETIHVRGGRNVSLDVLTTRHPGAHGDMETPVISPLYPGEQRALSLAWTAYDPLAVSSPFFHVNLATDGASLAAAFANFGGPSLNLVWADSGGHIGYHAIGFVPVRGPAVQHPRAVAAPIVDPGTTPPDEGTDDNGTPETGAVQDQTAPGSEALRARTAHFTLSAYHPRPRRAASLRPRRVSRSGSRRQSPVVTRPGRRGRRAAVPLAAPAPALPKAQTKLQQPAEPPLPPVAPAIDYTIGSPISPLPVDALDANQAWSEYIPYDALPSVVDPRNGLLATANSRVSPDDYPYMLTTDWADPFRTERIVHLLQGRKGLTSDNMLHMETDVHSEVNLALSQRFAYAVDHAGKGALGSDAGRLHKAADVLRNWDGDMRTDSAAAAMVSVLRPALWQALLAPKLALQDGSDPAKTTSLLELYTWGERSTALELILQHRPARWLPRGFANWNDFLTTTLSQVLQASHEPSDPAHWRYGDLHTVEIAHPIFSTHRWLSRVVGVRSTTGKRPAPGDGTTIDQIGAHFGPSERFTADLSSEDAALGNLTTGESANPRSPWYLDQFRPWLAGTSFALPTAHTEMTHTLTMTP